MVLSEKKLIDIYFWSLPTMEAHVQMNIEITKPQQKYTENTQLVNSSMSQKMLEPVIHVSMKNCD